MASYNDYKAFIHEVWADGILKELKRKHIFVDGCTRSYEGLIRDQGDRVKIKTLGDLTLHKMLRDAVYDDIEAPEKLSSSDLEILVDQISYFNAAISRIDEVQADEKLSREFYSKAASKFANEEDCFVAKFANEALRADTEVKLLSNTAIALTAENVLDLIDEAVTKMYENDVDQSAYLEMIVPPKFHRVLTKAYKLLDTDNHEMLKNGRCGRYNNVWIKMSNNVAKNDEKIGEEAVGATDMIMVRTKRACAFVEQMQDIEMYRPPNKLAMNAVKGHILYGGKVIRPKEMIVIPVKSYATTV